MLGIEVFFVRRKGEVCGEGNDKWELKERTEVIKRYPFLFFLTCINSANN